LGDAAGYDHFLATGAVILLLSIFGTLQLIVSAAAFTILLYYLIANIAALYLPDTQKLYPKWIAVLGTVACVALALSLSLTTIVYGFALLAFGFSFRAIYRKFGKVASDHA
jgi:APA family basic amino acid/polyamine antiporter